MHRKFVRRGMIGLAATLAALALTGCSESEAPDCGALTVGEPWVRVAPAGAEVMGAYFTLSNTGSAKVVVNGVTSSQFDRAEMHETVVNDNGQASMQPLEKVTVPAGESIDFKPGGRHVMLFNPTQPYAAGDQVELILACGSQNAELPAAATVRAEQPGAQNEGDMAHDMDHTMHEDAAPAGQADDPGAAADDAATAN